jgi:hypothetical protein
MLRLTLFKTLLLLTVDAVEDRFGHKEAHRRQKGSGLI